VIGYAFDNGGVNLVVEFHKNDGRTAAHIHRAYFDGIDEFFPMYKRAITANRIEHREPATAE
jgi:hypothetical protein